MRSTSTILTLCAAVAVLTVWSPAARAQVVVNSGYDAGFQLVEEPADPRAIGMGTAATAYETRGFYYYNPAQPALAGRRYLSFEYGQATGDLRRAMLEGAWFFPNWFIAAGMPTTTIADIQAADEHGTLPLMFSSQTTMIALSGGYTWRGLTVALGLHGVQERIDVHTGYALSVSLGATYWILPERLSVGAAGFYPRFLTTSRSMLEEQWGEGAVLNRTGRAGVAWRDTLWTVSYAAALDIVYNDALENITVPVGIEVWPLEMLAVRLGKRFNHDTDKFNMGLGFRLEPITVDASFVITKWVEDAGLKWQIGLAYTLPSK
ncbi:MAG: hypothetical protein GF331_05160 [Chitinivibrionales bacterium]|nr:hypothetical protein [Chitinivibrionales bacterium]